MAKQDISARQLVDKVLSGELALPEMQRRYVWTTITEIFVLVNSLVEKSGEEILDHHLLPSTRTFWKLDKYNEFLSYRRDKIVQCINAFLKKSNG